MTTATAPSRVAATTEPQTKGKRVNLGRLAAWTAMIILILITLFPFYWMVRTAFSTSKSLFTDPASLLPVDFTTGRVSSASSGSRRRRRRKPRVAPGQR